MDNIFFLRSFGDFVIALYAISKSKNSTRFRYIVSSHLLELFEAIPEEFLPATLTIEFVDFGIQNNILGCFTNRHLISRSSGKELLSLRAYIKKIKNENGSGKIFVEQKRRIQWPRIFSGVQLDYIHYRGNIYESYANFFQSQQTQDLSVQQNGINGVNVVIFPGSRKKEKEIPASLLKRINELYKSTGKRITTAFLQSIPAQSDGDSIVYNNFSELISFIKQADFIITSDSLPAHISQLLNKPHWIFYPQKINTEWLTPGALETNYYAAFHEFEKFRMSFINGN